MLSAHHCSPQPLNASVVTLARGRLPQEVFDAIMATDHVLSFVGVRRSGVGKSRRAARKIIPHPLSEAEIHQFRLNEEEGASLEDPTFGFSIGDFVEVLAGPTKGVGRVGLQLCAQSPVGGSDVRDSLWLGQGKGATCG